MGVTCGEIGGVCDDVLMEYKEGAQMCNDDDLPSYEEKNSSGAIVGVVLGGILISFGLVVLISRRNAVEEKDLTFPSRPPANLGDITSEDATEDPASELNLTESYDDVDMTSGEEEKGIV